MPQSNRDGWTTQRLLAATEEPYNETILVLRSLRCANEALISHFRGQSRHAEFNEIMDWVREVDSHIRQLNPKFDARMRGEQGT